MRTRDIQVREVGDIARIKGKMGAISFLYGAYVYKCGVQ